MLYQLLRFLHIFTAIAAMGPHFASVILVRHMAKKPESVPSLMPILGRLINFPKHGAMAMLVTGIAMVAAHPAGWGMFKELWLMLSMILFFVNLIYGRAQVEPAAKQIGAAMAAGPVKAEEMAPLTKKLDSHFLVMTIVLVLIIVLMIYRPTL
ncbi:MAG: DUF2269 family protein [Bacillota bacterium]